VCVSVSGTLVAAAGNTSTASVPFATLFTVCLLLCLRACMLVVVVIAFVFLISLCQAVFGLVAVLDTCVFCCCLA
jgi:hypothetical protein